jgi:hypothetical protein
MQRSVNTSFSWMDSLDRTVPTIQAFVKQFRQAWEIRSNCPHAFAFPIHCLHELSHCPPPLVFGPKGLIKADQMFLSIFVQEIIATGFLEWPQNADGVPQAGRIECPGNILGPNFKCEECVEYFPCDKKPKEDCWVYKGFEEAFGISLGRIRSVWER